MEWNVMSPLLASLAPTVIALAGLAAALWAGYEARRARKLAEEGLRPTPEATAWLFPAALEADGEQGDARLFVAVRNRASLSFTLDRMVINLDGFELSDGGVVSEHGDQFDALHPSADNTERTFILTLRENGSRTRRMRYPDLSLFITWSDHATYRFATRITNMHTMMNGSP
jgi:hypothetical protein